MKHVHVKKLVLLSSICTLVALGLMALSLLSPKPIFLVLAMSVGQAIGALSFAMYLLAIALDLQKAPGAAAASSEALAARAPASDATKPAP